MNQIRLGQRDTKEPGDTTPMIKIATVLFPLFGEFDLVLVRRTQSVPPRTIDTKGEAVAAAPAAPSEPPPSGPRAARQPLLRLVEAA